MEGASLIASLTVLPHFPLSRSISPPFLYAVGALNQNRIRHTQEETGAHHAGDGKDLTLQLLRTRDGTGSAIENVVTVISDKGFADMHPQLGRETQSAQAPPGERQIGRAHVSTPITA